jgi:hypothetical protein
MKQKTTFTDTAEITNIGTGKTLTGEILDFKPAYMLVVSVNRQVRVILRYNASKKLYIGNVGALEFTSLGPKENITYQGRK